ncbi:MAG: hypothetical protein MUE85_04640 [Microscillaceae bacterium]|jgi:hypothetical protein|nr:hypothetical protein [Microscillaceae bacterium]
MEKILKKEFNEKDFKRRIRQAIHKQPQGTTIADLVVLTGLPIEWVEYLVRALLGEYPCRLRTNARDELVYVFDLSKKTESLRIILHDWVKAKIEYAPNHRIYGFLEKILRDTPEIKDRLFLEKVILNYIRHNEGKIVVAELVQITGWSIYQAETQIVRLLADYHGEASVTDEGVIIYQFAELADDADLDSEISASLKVWERPLPELTINDEYPSNPIQLFRFLYNLYLDWKNEKVRLKNVETYLLKGIFARLKSHISPEKDLKKIIQEIKPTKQYDYWWNRFMSAAGFEYAFVTTSTYQRETILQKKALELEAQINVDENGNLYYDFERLQKELDTIHKLRKISTL